jgi:hypothetical protein
MVDEAGTVEQADKILDAWIAEQESQSSPKTV